MNILSTSGGYNLLKNADDCARVCREFHGLGPVEQSRTRELEMVDVQHPGKGRAEAKAKPGTCE